MSDKNLVAIGEVLWDLFPSGRQLGGAPANFACHAQALGAQAALVSRVGQDTLGQEILARLQELAVNIAAIALDPARPTGTVEVEVAADGQPTFRIREGVAWDELAMTPAAREAVARADAVCFGSLAQRCPASRATILELVSATRPEAWRVFDVNLRQEFYSRETIEASLRVANALKLNERELTILADLLGLAWSPTEQMTALAELYELRCVALTRGDRGSVLFAQGQWSEHAGIPTRVKDTVGAGDSFAAAMTLGLLAGWDLDMINHRANAVAAFVTSCEGATPPLPENLRRLFAAGARRAQGAGPD